MAFIDVKNANGEVQTVPEHYLVEFPDQFKLVDPEVPDTQSSPAKAVTKKES